VCAAPERVDDLAARAGAAGVPITTLGDAGGDRLVVDGLVDISLADALSAWRRALPEALGEHAPA
ncbi:MAG: hypothetical protein M3Z83_07520, partial [Actinomycetota bacterium]|nr:hypothetical protein [Actinomycetota bacterium]